MAISTVLAVSGVGTALAFGPTLAVDDEALPVARPVACPALPNSGVPAPPVGFDGSARLVGTGVPTSMTLCRYEAGVAGVPVEVREGLRAVPSDLHLPRLLDGDGRDCGLTPGPTSFLVRLTYEGGGVSWLRSEGDGCEATTNGSLVSTVSIVGDLEETSTRGAWTRRALPEGNDEVNCYSYAAGRGGQEVELVPEGYDYVAACHDDGLRVLDADQRRRLRELVGGLELSPMFSGCSGRGVPRSFDGFTFVIRYPTGRSVHLALQPECGARLSNDSVQAHPDATTLDELLELAEGTP